uniref:Uncharacterized protein n=1 Tax=Triticum urartu TaxID=4572 RepID=A0A8R7PX66_TRIUA
MLITFATLKSQVTYLLLKDLVLNHVQFVGTRRRHPLLAKAGVEGSQQRSDKLGSDACQPLHLVPCHLQPRQLRHPSGFGERRHLRHPDSSTGTTEEPAVPGAIREQYEWTNTNDPGQPDTPGQP